MYIIRHNYEEYFILYMDNELGADERRMVESFVQSNPDLKDELDSLLQYKLEADTSISFAGKEELMKVNGETPVTFSNYEDWLYLYADNELSGTQKAAVETFIASNLSVSKEWELIQKSKLQADESIVFANKEVLYRREEKVRPLLPRWWRIAAAAVVLIAAGLTTAIIINTNKSGDTKLPVATTIDTKNNNAQPATAVVNSPEQAGNPVAAANTGNNTNTVSNSNPDNKKKETIPVVNVPDNNNVAQKNNGPAPEKNNPVIITPEQLKNKETGIAENKPGNQTNNLPVPDQNPYYNNNRKKEDAIAKTEIPAEIKNQTPPLTDPVVTTGNPQTSDIVQASLQENGKKNKLRGFLRKVTRTFEKRTNIEATDGNDRLLIAGLSFKMK